MHVQELNDLANWFKANVLDITPVIYDGIHETDIPNEHIFSSHKDRLRAIEDDAREYEDELNLLEFIIGVNDVEIHA